MNWQSLKRNECPKCGGDLADKLVGDMFRCSCGFMISAKRFREIVSDTVSRGIKEEKHYRPPDEEPEI